MITLNRLGHSDEPFQLNPDMIVTIESTPDTVIALATGAKVVVAESPEDVAAAVHAHRAAVLSDALRRRSDLRQSARAASAGTAVAAAAARRCTSHGRRGPQSRRMTARRCSRRPSGGRRIYGESRDYHGMTDATK